MRRGRGRRRRVTRKMGDDAGCADDEEEDADEEEGSDVDDEANCGEADEA